MESKALYTPEEVASYLRIKIRGVYHIIKTNQLEAVRVGRRYRITDTSLSKYIGRETLNTLIAK